MIEFDWISIITVVGIIQGFFFSLILIRSKWGNKKANIFLSLLMLSVAISISYDVLIYTKLYTEFPQFIKTTVPFQFLIAPFLFLFIKQLLFEQYDRKTIFIHLIPFVAVIIILSPFYSLSSPQKIESVNALLNGQRQISITELIILLGYQLQMWTYFYIIFKKIKNHQNKIKNNFSNIRGIDLHWLQIFLTIILFIYFLILIIFILIRLNISSFEVERIVPLLVSFSIYLIGYRWLILLSNDNINRTFDKLSGKLSEIPKYEKSSLTEEELNKYKERLEEYLFIERKYLDPYLTLEELANNLSLSRHTLSQVINQKFDMNFFNLINSYRVEEAKKCILELNKEKRTLLDIAFACGFNSKATFNSAFKKCTNLTPTQFKNQFKK